MKKLLALLTYLFLSACARPEDPGQFRPPQIECMQPDPLLHFLPKPFCSGTAVNVDGSKLNYRLNSMGLWDKEYASAPAENRARLLLLGGSWLVPHRAGPDARAVLAKELGAPFEVINGAMNGFSLPQGYLFLDRLLDRYQPKFVVLVTSIRGYGLNSFYYDRIAAKYDPNTGLAESLGPVENFWPLPNSASDWIWKKNYALRWMFWSRVAREIFLLAKSEIAGPGLYEVYEKYLRGLNLLSQKKGAKLIILRIDSKSEMDTNPLQPVVNYMAETQVKAWWPFTLFPDEKTERLYSKLQEQDIPVFTLDTSFVDPLRRQPSLYFIPQDRHLTEEGMRLLGAAMAEALRQPLKQSR